MQFLPGPFVLVVVVALAVVSMVVVVVTRGLVRPLTVVVPAVAVAGFPAVVVGLLVSAKFLVAPTKILGFTSCFCRGGWFLTDIRTPFCFLRS